jgi:hypothetical protein
MSILQDSFCTNSMCNNDESCESSSHHVHSKLQQKRLGVEVETPIQSDHADDPPSTTTTTTATATTTTSSSVQGKHGKSLPNWYYQVWMIVHCMYSRNNQRKNDSHTYPFLLPCL